MKLCAALLGAALLQAQTAVPVEPALEEIGATTRFLQAAVSRDGSRVAYVEGSGAGKSAIYASVPPVRHTAVLGGIACPGRD
ncbi:MAG: hypothetical protein LAQ30_09950 [Acidobacteriia bacterium]|nr:hypothetical protein [Terriglobia bacterium]